MAVLFKKTVSLFKTTLSSKMTSSQTTMDLQAVPGGNIEYPNWFVVEPNSANAEIVYCPTAPSGTTFSSVVRGVDKTLDTDGSGTGIAHPANVDVVLAPMHRQWNSAVEVLTGTSGTGYNAFRVGDGTDVNVTYYAQNADVAKPYFQYNATQNKWLISNDGSTTYDITSGGSGLTRGLGVTVSASAINLDVRTSGGLRNNQGTGSQQADVDPAIVARLDTANTWTAAQSLTAAYLLVTTDAASANEAVRLSLLQTSVSQGAVTGTSGEAITAGQGLYVKASDGKLYKSAGTSDEAAFNFVGVALTDAAGADVTVYFAPPGHVATLVSTSAGSPYFVTDVAGTLGTSPGTRFARVGIGLPGNRLLVTVPKYIASGSFTYQFNDASPLPAQTVGFLPGLIHFFATSDGIVASVGTNFGQVMSGGTGVYAHNSSNAWYVKDSGGNASTGNAGALSSTGFTPTHSSVSNTSQATVRWVAESL